MLQSERFWILLLALTAFLAGGAGGIVVGREMAPVVEVGPFSDFEELFVQKFSLDDQRRRDLRYILDRYHAQVEEELEPKQVTLLEDKLSQYGTTCRERIRTWVLKPADREVFDQLVSGLAPSIPPTR